MKKQQSPNKKQPPRLQPNRRTVVLSLCAILLVVFVAYLPSLKNGFTNWDDDRYVIANPLIQDLSWDGIKNIFSVFFDGNYHPFTLISYALEFHAYHLDPGVYHTTNLVLHLANSLLVVWLVYKFSGKFLTSFIVGLLFGIHPLHVESVAWIAERKDLLYSLFFLGALISYLHFRQIRLNKRYYYLSLVLFMFSCLSKGMAVTLPAILILFDYYFDSKLSKRTLLEKIPFLTGSLIFGVVAILAQHNEGSMVNAATYTMLDQIFIASYGLLFYLYKLFVPISLSAIYPYPDKSNGLLPLMYLVSPIIVGIVVFLIFYLKRYSGSIILGTIFFFLSILPVLQLLPVGGVVVADRYFYISSIGLFYIVADRMVYFYNINSERSKNLKAALIAAAIAVVMISSFLTWERVLVWKNSITLFSDVISKQPNCGEAYLNLANAYSEAENDDKAIALLQTATEVSPNYANAYCNMGNAYFRKGKFDKAMECY